MKISSIPKSGRKGSVVYLKTRHGNVARQYVLPRNPCTTEQQSHRDNVRAVSIRWPTLTPEQRAAWRVGAANRYFVSKTGRPVCLNGCNFFVSLNTRRADLGLPQFDLPPAEPVFSPNPVAELAITNTGGRITLKLRVPSPPIQYTLVQGPAPVRTGVRCVQHFPFLGCCPPQPTAGATLPSFTSPDTACQRSGRPFGYAPASTLTAGSMFPRWSAPAFPPKLHSDAHGRRLASAAAATGVRDPVERVPTWRNWGWISP
jgi:hypothetical protein